jgi:hypothetical protein
MKKKKVNFTMENSDGARVNLHTGFSWILFLWSWVGIPLFRRKMYLFAFISLIITVHFLTFFFKGMSGIASEVGQLSITTPEEINTIYRKYFPLWRDILENTIFAIPCGLFGRWGNLWTGKMLIKQGWRVKEENLSEEEKKLVNNFLYGNKLSNN